MAFVALIAFCTAACSPTPQLERSETPRSTSEVLREISFAPYASIRLGEPLAARTPRTRPAGDGWLALTGSGFGGTDSIRIRLTPDGNVQVVHFFYPADYDFAASVVDYQGALGPPLSRDIGDSAGGILESVSWSDDSTSFTLSRLTRRGRLPGHFSVLQNVAR